MVTRSTCAGYEGWLYLVCNASRKAEDYAHIEQHLPANVKLKRGTDCRSLPCRAQAEAVLAKIGPAVRDITFMY